MIRPTPHSVIFYGPRDGKNHAREDHRDSTPRAFEQVTQKRWGWLKEVQCDPDAGRERAAWPQTAGETVLFLGRKSNDSNRAQQTFCLPEVEAGHILWFGATTEKSILSGQKPAHQDAATGIQF